MNGNLKYYPNLLLHVDTATTQEVLTTTAENRILPNRLYIVLAVTVTVVIVLCAVGVGLAVWCLRWKIKPRKLPETIHIRENAVAVGAASSNTEQEIYINATNNTYEDVVCGH